MKIHIIIYFLVVLKIFFCQDLEEEKYLNNTTQKHIEILEENTDVMDKFQDKYTL